MCLRPPFGRDVGGREARSSSREFRIRVPFFSVVYSSGGTLSPKTGKRALLGDLGGRSLFTGQAESKHLERKLPVMSLPFYKRWARDFLRGSPKVVS